VSEDERRERVERVLVLVIKHTGLTRAELERRIDQKLANLKGLINRLSATVIVGKELGVPIPDKMWRRP
jgi:hypothetical protein